MDLMGEKQSSDSSSSKPTDISKAGSCRSGRERKERTKSGPRCLLSDPKNVRNHDVAVDVSPPLSVTQPFLVVPSFLCDCGLSHLPSPFAQRAGPLPSSETYQTSG